MKNIFTFLVFILLSTLSVAQIQVESTGDVQVAETAGSARAHLDVNVTSNSKPQATFGSFTIQAADNFNGFLMNNGRQAGNNARAFNTGKLAMFQFVNGQIWMRSTPETTAGQNTGTFFNHVMTGNNNTRGYTSIGGAPQSSWDFYVYGNAFKTTGGDTWNVASDRQLKKNIKKFDSGLDVVLKMNPVEYEYNGEGGTIDGEYQIGVVAQELQKIAPFMVNSFLYEDSKEEYKKMIPDTEKIQKSKKEFLSINASAVKWMLVSAVKEQNEIIEENIKEISDLHEIISSLSNRLDELEAKNNNASSVQLTDESNGVELSNSPNPFTNTTTIKYRIPVNAVTAQINVFSTSGQLLKQIKIDNTGSGTISLTAEDLPSGNYSYNLVVDGDVIKTNKMVVMR